MEKKQIHNNTKLMPFISEPRIIPLGPERSQRREADHERCLLLSCVIFFQKQTSFLSHRYNSKNEMNQNTILVLPQFCKVVIRL